MQCLSAYPCATYAATDTVCATCAESYQRYHEQQMRTNVTNAIRLLKHLGYEIKEPPKRR